MVRPLNLIDAHHHLWIPQSRSPDLGYGWLRDIGAMKPFGDPTPIQRNYEWPEFIAESSHRLQGSVYVQVDGAIADPVAETAWVQQVFDKTGLVHGIVGFADLSGSDAERVISEQAAWPSFRGVRQILSRLDDQPALCFAPEHYLRSAVWREQFQLLAQHELSFDLQCYPEQMAEAAEFLSLHPDTAVIVDHAGSPHDQSSQGLARLDEGLKVLADLPQVSIKLSGFGMFDKQRNTDGVRPIFDLILERFGTERVLFGSNFPVDSLMGTYDSLVTIIEACLSGCKKEEKQAIFTENSRRIYRI